METINDFFAAASSLLWGWPMIILLLGTHVFLTIRLRCPQLRLLTAIRLSIRRDKDASGDVVIVRQQEDADTGDTAVVLVNGESATVKRIKKEPDGGLWLLPNNPAYDPQHYSPAEVAEKPVRIIGKVVELRGKF